MPYWLGAAAKVTTSARSLPLRDHVGVDIYAVIA